MRSPGSHPFIPFMIATGLWCGCAGRDPLPCPIPESPATILLRAQENPTTLDPAYVTRAFESHLACLVHGGLVRCAEDGSLVPELAGAWTWTEAGTVLSFRLRQNLRFPDGSPLSVDDVLYSLNRIVDPETASPQSWVLEDVNGYQEVRSGTTEHLSGLVATGTQTIEFRLKEPSATLLAKLSMPGARIVSRRAVNHSGDRYGREPAGLGAWGLADWVDDSYVELRPNPDYPGANRHLGAIRFVIAPQDFTASALFETGGLHVLHPLPIRQAERWKGFSSWRAGIQKVTEMNVYYLGFGCHRPPFDRPEIRRAIRSVIEPERIRKALLGDLAVPAFGPVPPGMVGAVERDLPDEEVDRSLLEGLSLDLWFIESDTTASLAMEAVQADLAAAGVQCRLRKVDPTTYGRWRREGRFDMFFANWWADYPDPDNFFAPLFSTGAGSNYTRFEDQELDRLIAEGRMRVVEQDRGEIYVQAAARLNALAPVVFLWHRGSEVLTQPWVTQYESSPVVHGSLFTQLAIKSPVATPVEATARTHSAAR